MEDNFRNVLILISAIVIIAIFVHGLWTIRKQKNPYKLKTTKTKVEPLTRDFDKKGFDQDGVSQVKVTKLDETTQFNSDEINAINASESAVKDVKKQKPLHQSQVITTDDLLSKTTETSPRSVNSSTDSSTENTMGSLDGSVDADWFKEEPDVKAYQESDAEEVSLSPFSKDELGDELTLTTESYQQSSDQKENSPKPKAAKPVAPKIIEPLYEQPVTQAKPLRTPIKKIKKSPSKAELKRDQIEIDFDNPTVETTNIPEKTTQPKRSAKVELEPQVIILSVVMPANQQMFGAALLPSLLTLGLKYGEMNIFHRHEDNAGNGKVTFSLANILNPGTFDLDSMENFATRGVSLFMTLPNAGDSFIVFEQMLNAAKQLAQEFNAQVLDDKRNVLTKQSEQHYLSKIREFDRKSRISLVE